MSIVTISRQIGSMGSEIGRQVADQLGYRLIGRDLINQAARRAGAPAVALAMIDEFQLLGICPSPEECQKYTEVVEQILLETASQGNMVIIGRAGQILLADWPLCLHIRIIAPKELRIQRVAQQHKISTSAARERVIASDRYRKNYLQRFYHINWNKPQYYDLVINTRQFSVPQAARLICEHIKIVSDIETAPVRSPGEED
jgi:cytidylate kinase